MVKKYDASLDHLFGYLIESFFVAFSFIVCNNFNLAVMSASLPRIRTLAEMAKQGEENK